MEMKNTLVRDYLILINIFGENIITDIKISTYNDVIACYNIKYFDVELSKKRQKLVTIKLSDYHKFTDREIRKQKLKLLNNI